MKVNGSFLLAESLRRANQPWSLPSAVAVFLSESDNVVPKSLHLLLFQVSNDTPSKKCNVSAIAKVGSCCRLLILQKLFLTLGQLERTWEW